jgi:TonB family protein
MGLALVAGKVTCVLLFGLLLVAALRRRQAALRHVVLVASVLSGALVPAAGLVTPAWLPLRTATASLAPDVTSTALTRSDAIRVADQVPPAYRPEWTPLRTILAMWSAGSAVALLRLALALWRLRVLRQSTEVLDDLPWMATLTERCRALGVHRTVTIRVGGTSAPVMTWGLRTPQLLVPAAAVHWPEAQRRFVLTHELSHVARHDWLWLLLMEVTRALYCWHPLMWLAVRKARDEAEHACDDRVLLHEARPSDYASVLVDLARETARPLSSVVTAMTNDSLLERRISTMLDNSINHAPVRRLTHWATLVLILAANIVLTGAGAQAQSDGLGTVVGTVRPNGGLPLAGVAVTLSGGPEEVRIETDANGTFSAVLPAGTYTAAIRVPGFKRFKTIVDVAAGERVTRDFALALGALTETVSVAGETNPSEEPINLKPEVPITRSIGVITTPHRLTHKAPAYPAELREAGIDGVVTLSARIGVDGHMTDVAVLQSPHPALTALVTEHVARWRYEPTRVQGVAVTTDVTVTFNFTATPEP